MVRTTAGPAILRVAAALWIVAGLWYLVTEAVVAKHLPGYSYSADYISDLGRPLHSPLAAWMNGAFIAQGVAFALAGALVVTEGREALQLAAGVLEPVRSHVGLLDVPRELSRVVRVSVRQARHPRILAGGGPRRTYGST